MKAELGITAGNFELILSEAFLQDVLDDFMKNYLFNESVPGSLASQYYKRANNADEYALKPLPARNNAIGEAPFGSKVRRKDLEAEVKTNHLAHYQSAFKSALPTLWQGIAASVSTSGGGDVGANIGQLARLRRIPIGISMPNGRASSSPFNSFFMATEFGTGVYANRIFRRRTGPSKVGNKGVWAYNSGRGDSPLFLGQKPFNLFYNKSGDKRNSFQKFAARKLPIALKKAFKTVRQRMLNGR